MAADGIIELWTRRASTIWKPTVYTGLSAVIGSWKITAMSLPRAFRSVAWSAPSIATPLSFALPRTRPFLGSRPSSDMELTDLPEPDSPTIASTSPGLTL